MGRRSLAVIALLMLGTWTPKSTVWGASQQRKASVQRIWASAYNGPGSGADRAVDIGVSHDGSRAYVTGKSFGGPTTKYDWATVAYDTTTGAQLWVARYIGATGLDDSPGALVVSPDDAMVFVSGQQDGIQGDYATVAYNAETGAQLWAARYESPDRSAGFATGVDVSPDGSRVYVTGCSYAGPTLYDWATLAYDAATGTQLWVTRFNGPENNNEFAWDVQISPDGSHLYVTGYSYSFGGLSDALTIAYNATTGAQAWASRYDGPAGNNDYSYSLGISPDGARIYVGGYGENAALLTDYATIAYDAATGTQLWATRYDGPQRSSDYANYLAVSADGLRVFVAGSSQGHFGLDYATVGYDAATGTQLWATRFHAPGNKNDEPKGLAVSPDGARVYVTGQSYVGVTRYDAVTVAYDAATGAAIWTVRAGQARADSGMGVEVSPNGVALYVTGDYSSLLSHTEDYGTIAYMTGVSFPV